MWPEPAVERALDAWEVVRAVGWEGAVALLDVEFRGWEVEFLGLALSLLSTADRAEDRIDQHRFWAQVIGGRRG